MVRFIHYFIEHKENGWEGFAKSKFAVLMGYGEKGGWNAVSYQPLAGAEACKISFGI